MLQIIESDKILLPDEIFTLPGVALNQSWNGLLLPWSLFFNVVLDPQYLWFCGGAKVTNLPPPQDSSEGKYYEGLWHYDVIELFISIQAPHYLEFHVSPGGRWWCMKFEQSLKREDGYNPEGVCSYISDSDEQNWKTSLRIPRDHITKYLGGMPEYGNIAAKFCSHPEPTPYVSLVTFGGDKPNFHQPELFTNILYSRI